METHMKLLSSLLTVFLLTCVLTTVNASEVKAKKMYVAKEDVQIENGRITVQLPDGVMLVKSLRSDNRGIFVLKTDVVSVEKGSYFCTQCKSWFIDWKEYIKHKQYTCYKRKW